MRDVPRVLDWYAILCFEAYCAGPGDVCHPVGALPHGRELVETFLGEDPPKDKVACLESVWAYVVAELLYGRRLRNVERTLRRRSSARSFCEAWR